MTTVKPSAPSRSATAAPMPREAPVTIAILLVLSVISISSLLPGLPRPFDPLTSCQRSGLEMHIRQVADSVSRVTQNFAIGAAERSQVTIAEISDGAQNLRRFATEHLPEG